MKTYFIHTPVAQRLEQAPYKGETLVQLHSGVPWEIEFESQFFRHTRLVQQENYCFTRRGHRSVTYTEYQNDDKEKYMNKTERLLIDKDYITFDKEKRTIKANKKGF